MRANLPSQPWMRRRPLAVAALLAIAISVGWLMADESIEEPAATFFEPLRVPLVSVDVVVTDKVGVPILGLIQEDFEVFEDGAPVEITHFFAADPAKEPTDDPDQPRYLPESFRQDVYLALYFDDSNINMQRRTSALHHLRDFLEQPLPPNLKTMLVRYDGSLHVEVDFSDRPRSSESWTSRPSPWRIAVRRSFAGCKLSRPAHDIN